jgi:uncharacterized membrane protein
MAQVLRARAAGTGLGHPESRPVRSRLPYLDTRTGRVFATFALGLALATAVGVVILWPGDKPDLELAAVSAADSERAEVVGVTSEQCPPPQKGFCRSADVQLESGPDEGETTTIELGLGVTAPDLRPGDSIRVTATAPPQPVPSGQEGAQPPAAPAGDAPSYTFADYERRSPMLWLAIAFAALVVVFARLRGVLSLLGLGISLAIVVGFIVPAILDGSSPLPVALVGSMAVMLVTITLAHGVGAKSLAAIVGTAASLLLVAILAEVFTDLTQLTGRSSEEATLLQVGGVGIDFQGLLLAGILIAALGVLDDVTVSQASTVMALRAASPGMGFGELYRRALSVGRDHVSATVNTLVLAYVGSSLPVLLILGAGGVGIGDALNGELVAKEVVGTLVGSIGLIAAVPLTTAAAGLIAGDLDAADLEAAAEGAHTH